MTYIEDIYTVDESDGGAEIINIKPDIKFHEVLQVKVILVELIGEKKFAALFINFGDKISIFKIFLKTAVHYITEAVSYTLRKYGGHHYSITHMKGILELINASIVLEKRRFIKAHQADVNIPKTYLKHSPLKHQYAAFEAVDKILGETMYRGLVIAGDPGTGKTYMALYLSLLFKSDFTIIICPAEVLDNAWIADIAGGTCEFKSKQPYINARLDPSKNVSISKAKYLIINYQSIHKVTANYLKDIKNRYNRISVIVDESHNLANYDNDRSRAAFELVNKINPFMVLLLSGTDIRRGSNEIKTMLAFLYKGFYSSEVEESFEILFGRSGPVRETILADMYRSIRIRVSHPEGAIPDNHLIDIDVTVPNDSRYDMDFVRSIKAEKTKIAYEEIVALEATNKLRLIELVNRAGKEAVEKGVIKQDKFDDYFKSREKLYKIKSSGNRSYIEGISGELRKFEGSFIEPYLHKEDLTNFRSIRSSIDDPMGKARGIGLFEVTKLRKELAIKVAHTIDLNIVYKYGRKKAVYFSDFIEVTEILERRLKDIGRRPISMHSKSQYSVSKDLNLFANGEKYTDLLTTYKSASEAVRLTMADKTILVDWPTSYSALKQVKARTNRKNQDTDTFLFQVRLNTKNKDNLHKKMYDKLIDIAKDVGTLRGEMENIDLIEYIM